MRIGDFGDQLPYVSVADDGSTPAFRFLRLRLQSIVSAVLLPSSLMRSHHTIIQVADILKTAGLCRQPKALEDTHGDIVAIDNGNRH